MKIKTAMILAAGFGKRLYPYTMNTPKPLIEVYNKTLLSYAIEMLESIGIKKIIINTHYKKNQINNYIRSNYKKSHIILKNEKILLDTGGGIKNIIKELDNNLLLVINSDMLWQKHNYHDLKNLIKNHNKEFKCSLLLSNIKKLYGIKKQIGDFKLQNKYILRNYIYKKGLIYSGAQVIDISVFRPIKGKIFSLNKVWDLLISNKQITGILMKSDLLHLGTLRGFKHLNKFKP